MPKPSIPILPSDPETNRAVQALAKGVASESQQIMVFRYIVYELAGTYGMSFDPESDRMTSFNEGRRHVGRVLTGIVNTPFAALEKRSKTRGG